MLGITPLLPPLQTESSFLGLPDIDMKDIDDYEDLMAVDNDKWHECQPSPSSSLSAPSSNPLEAPYPASSPVTIATSSAHSRGLSTASSSTQRNPMQLEGVAASMHAAKSLLATAPSISQASPLNSHFSLSASKGMNATGLGKYIVGIDRDRPGSSSSQITSQHIDLNLTTPSNSVLSPAATQVVVEEDKGNFMSPGASHVGLVKGNSRISSSQLMPLHVDTKSITPPGSPLVARSISCVVERTKFGANSFHTKPLTSPQLTGATSVKIEKGRSRAEPSQIMPPHPDGISKPKALPTWLIELINGDIDNKPNASGSQIAPLHRGSSSTTLPISAPSTRALRSEIDEEKSGASPPTSIISRNPQSSSSSTAPVHIHPSSPVVSVSSPRYSPQVVGASKSLPSAATCLSRTTALPLCSGFESMPSTPPVAIKQGGVSVRQVQASAPHVSSSLSLALGIPPPIFASCSGPLCSLFDSKESQTITKSMSNSVPIPMHASVNSLPSRLPVEPAKQSQILALGLSVTTAGSSRTAFPSAQVNSSACSPAAAVVRPPIPAPNPRFSTGVALVQGQSRAVIASPMGTSSTGSQSEVQEDANKPPDMLGIAVASISHVAKPSVYAVPSTSTIVSEPLVPTLPPVIASPGLLITATESCPQVSEPERQSRRQGLDFLSMAATFDPNITPSAAHETSLKTSTSTSFLTSNLQAFDTTPFCAVSTSVTSFPVPSEFSPEPQEPTKQSSPLVPQLLDIAPASALRAEPPVVHASAQISGPLTTEHTVTSENQSKSEVTAVRNIGISKVAKKKSLEPCASPLVASDKDTTDPALVLASVGLSLPSRVPEVVVSSSIQVPGLSTAIPPIRSLSFSPGPANNPYFEGKIKGASNSINALAKNKRVSDDILKQEASLPTHFYPAIQPEKTVESRGESPTAEDIGSVPKVNLISLKGKFHKNSAGSSLQFVNPKEQGTSGKRLQDQESNSGSIPGLAAGRSACFSSSGGQSDVKNPPQPVYLDEWKEGLGCRKGDVFWRNRNPFAALWDTLTLSLNSPPVMLTTTDSTQNATPSSFTLPLLPHVRSPVEPVFVVALETKAIPIPILDHTNSSSSMKDNAHTRKHKRRRKAKKRKRKVAKKVSRWLKNLEVPKVMGRKPWKTWSAKFEDDDDELNETSPDEIPKWHSLLAAFRAIFWPSVYLLLFYRDFIPTCIAPGFAWLHSSVSYIVLLQGFLQIVSTFL
ncbi:hypothetical protein BDQ17DRAFT_353500 [Cyathus striatus]|nr:hypothetical protein BDQ17DRAFT_353500 [Cyathus striatus]